ASGRHWARTSDRHQCLGVLRSGDHPPGAGLDRLRGELAAVAVLPAKAEEEVARADYRGVDDRPRRRLGRALGEHPRTGRRRDLPPAEPHAGLPCLRSSSRAPSRSSKGIFLPPSNPCPCSWPLPAITPVSPGRARPSASAIAAWRSTSTISSASPSRAPAATSATIASGSSERGLSEVTTARS